MEPTGWEATRFRICSSSAGVRGSPLRRPPGERARRPPIPRKSRKRRASFSPYAVHRDLQEKMQRLVGIFRVEEDLRRALTEIAALWERLARVHVEGSRLFNPGWHLARDLKSMLTVTEAVTRSALTRQESRGAHSRIDYPKTDPAWGKKNNVISREGDTMKLAQSAVPEMPADLKAIVESQ